MVAFAQLVVPLPKPALPAPFVHFNTSIRQNVFTSITSYGLFGGLIVEAPFEQQLPCTMNDNEHLFTHIITHQSLLEQSNAHHNAFLQGSQLSLN